MAGSLDEDIIVTVRENYKIIYDMDVGEIRHKAFFCERGIASAAACRSRLVVRYAFRDPDSDECGLDSTDVN